LQDVAKNLIGRLGFADCTLYLWNEDKTKMIQKAGFTQGGFIDDINIHPREVVPEQEVMGFVMTTGESLIVKDNSADPRYRPSEIRGLSEITVPVIYNKSVVGIIDSQHPQKDFFKPHHMQILNTVATLMANKIISIEAEQSLRQTQVEMYAINEQLSNAKLEALRSQMNPHFIFNCINSIDALIQSNDKYGATVYLNKFAKLLRNILDGSRENTVSFSKDLDTLKLYVELEQLRHENKFVSSFTVDEELLFGDYKVPSLVVQPFVENAILHGLKNKAGNDGILAVQIQKQHGGIRYCVTDNGVGRIAANNLAKNKKPHYGMQISADRINLFNKKETGAVEVCDLYENGRATGTQIIVQLNVT
jgi:LytS/YehU family sensor histidine kinase